MPRRPQAKHTAVKSAANPPAAAAAAGVETDLVFEMAAEVFRVMSAPMRLKIIASLCNGEKNVTQLLDEIEPAQPNMSLHLITLYQAGVLGKRRDGVQMNNSNKNDHNNTQNHTVCTQIAIEADGAR